MNPILRKVISRYGPALAVLPLLVSPIPTLDYPAREIAGYFQSLAFARSGLQSFYYATPDESASALHLHSILASPLVEIGYLQAGRLISLLAALIATTIVALIATDLYDRRAGLLAAPIMWVFPQFMRFSSRYWPESLSIALTLGSVYAILQYQTEESRYWYFVGLLCLGLGITNHMWEATIALPLVAILVLNRDWLEAIGVAVASVTVAGVVWYITTLQPASAGQLTQFALYNNPQVLLTAEFWLHSDSLHPLNIAKTLILPVGLISLLYCSVKAVRSQNPRRVLLASWLASGAFIPIALAIGYHHWYYSWGLIAPLAILFSRTLSNATGYISPFTQKQVAHVLLVGLLLSSMSYGLVFESAILAGTGAPLVGAISSPTNPPISDLGVEDINDGEALAAGDALANMEVDDASSVTFVGWPEDKNYYHIPGAARILIYGDILVKERAPNQGDQGPVFTSNESTPSCEALITLNDGNITATRCPS